MSLFPIVRVVFSVPNKTISTIVLTAFGDNRSEGLIKLPAALLIINVGTPNSLIQKSKAFWICVTSLTSDGK